MAVPRVLISRVLTFIDVYSGIYGQKTKHTKIIGKMLKKQINLVVSKQKMFLSIDHFFHLNLVNSSLTFKNKVKFL